MFRYNKAVCLFSFRGIERVERERQRERQTQRETERVRYRDRKRERRRERERKKENPNRRKKNESRFRNKTDEVYKVKRLYLKLIIVMLFLFSAIIIKLCAFFLLARERE